MSADLKALGKRSKVRAASVPSQGFPDKKDHFCKANQEKKAGGAGEALHRIHRKGRLVRTWLTSCLDAP